MKQLGIWALLLAWLGYAQCPMYGWWGGGWWGGPWGFFGWVLGFAAMLLFLGLLLLLFIWLYRQLFSSKTHN